MNEHEHQKAVFEWAGYMLGRFPELHTMHAIPNGGHRDVRVARKLKAEGVKPGVSDICWPCPRGGYHGLYLEMKKVGGYLDKAGTQTAWLESMAAMNYRAVCAWGFESAIKALQDYLFLPMSTDKPIDETFLKYKRKKKGGPL